MCICGIRHGRAIIKQNRKFICPQNMLRSPCQWLLGHRFSVVFVLSNCLCALGICVCTRMHAWFVGNQVKLWSKRPHLVSHVAFHWRGLWQHFKHSFPLESHMYSIQRFDTSVLCDSSRSLYWQEKMLQLATPKLSTPSVSNHLKCFLRLRIQLQTSHIDTQRFTCTHTNTRRPPSCIWSASSSAN